MDKPWEQVHDGMRVKLVEKGERAVRAGPERGPRQKENAMRRRKLKELVHGLNRSSGDERERSGTAAGEAGGAQEGGRPIARS